MKENRKMKRKYKNLKVACYTLFLTMIPMPIYAAGDPTAGVNKLTQLITSIVSAIGLAILIWSAVNLGLAIKRRDPAATTEGILGVVGGLIIAGAPYVANYLLS